VANLEVDVSLGQRNGRVVANVAKALRSKKKKKKKRGDQSQKEKKKKKKKSKRE